ncbi:DUF4270 domain-containing protein [Mucilaginibacter rigui]|uniref:DUF4270 domain-containing protein n=1 Tax=Mucilaginibacter rigui TaxID=534635 RepID=A0ABR7X4H1_9SPHI|nr:DUF4270 domain-containing protein [Mucilaginibacter rigui]MBD1385477.1 DUF4270 domain-containing protein [Mucilaginibacter rigui]
MKFYKLGLLTLLISLFILNSCKTQDGIGLDPATPIAGKLIADTSIMATTVKEDSVITSGLSSRVPLSYFKDPEFGTTETNIAMVLSTPGATAYTLPTGTITIDSARLILPYATDGFYGDSLLSTYKIDVRQLSERIVATKSYYNTKHFESYSDIIGSKTFSARAHDTLKILNMVKGGPDTLIKVKPQVRIPIDPDFINQHFFLVAQTVLSNPVIYENQMNGLYISLDKNQTPGVGGNMYFNLDSAALTIYYKNINGSTTDTTSISLSLGRKVTEIKHTYSTKVLAALDNTSTKGLVYLQGLAGLRAKLTLPDVKSIFASEGGSDNVVLNRAELIVKVDPGSATPFAPSKRLTLYKYDIARQRTTLQDASSTDPRASNFGGAYNAATGEYHFIITAYLQDLLRGKTVDYGTFLAPVNPTGTTIDVTPASTYADRSIIVGKNSPYRVKLNIIYTKINQ